MKKLIPVVLVVLGIGVLVGVFFLRGKLKKTDDQELPVQEEVMIDLSPEESPIVSLIPTSDGHYLTLAVKNIRIENVDTMDYELLYVLPNGVTQGVPGTASIKGGLSFEVELLMGSESSGKFRYDEGVEDGTITLWFRDEKGRLIAKIMSDFKLTTGEDILESTDASFRYELNTTPDEGYFVIMSTVGYPEGIDGLTSGPWGVFSSESTKFPGKVDSTWKAALYNGNKWQHLDENNSPDIGIFVGTGSE